MMSANSEKSVKFWKVGVIPYLLVWQRQRPSGQFSHDACHMSYSSMPCPHKECQVSGSYLDADVTWCDSVWYVARQWTPVSSSMSHLLEGGMCNINTIQ